MPGLYRLTGLFFLLVLAIWNVWFVEGVLSPDGQLNNYTKGLIWISDFVLLAIGLLIIKYQREVGLSIFLFSAYKLLPEVLTLGLAGILYFLTYISFELNPEILDTHIHALNLQSTKYQGLIYILIFAIFAVACASVLLVRERFEFSEDFSPFVVAFSLLCFGTWEKTQAFGFGLGILGCIEYRWNETFREFVKKIMKLCKRHDKVLRSLGWFAIIVLVISFWIVPLFSPMFVASLKDLRWIEGHYANTVLGGRDLVLRDDFQVKRPDYGLGVPLLTAAFYKVAYYLRISSVELPDAVKFYQLFSLILIGIILFIVNKRNLILGVLLTISLTLFILSNVADSIGYPNHTGIRYAPILLGLLVYALELTRQIPRVSILAITAATVVVFSPDTGLALTGGFIVAAILIEYKSSTPLSSICLTFGKFSTVFCFAFLFLFYLIVRPLLITSGGSNFELLWLFGVSGYGGIVNRLSPSAGLIFLIATTTVLRIFVRARNGNLLRMDVWQVAIASVMLVWFYYYINRLVEVNLWFQWVLLVFLFAPLLDLGKFKVESPKPYKSHPLDIVLISLIASQLVFSTAIAFSQSRSWFNTYRSGCLSTDQLNGICLPGFGTDAMSKQLAALNEFSPSDSIVLTGFPTAVRLKGFNENFPLFDPMAIALKKDVSKLVDWIESKGPRFILADGPASSATLASPEHTEQIWLYLSSLKSYREVERRSDWVIFERIRNNEKHK